LTKKALVFANGEIHDGLMVQRALETAPESLVIAADGGARIAQHYQIPLQMVIGDMDSVGEAELAKLADQGVQIERHPVHKDEIDLELALLRAIELGADWIRIIGALGGRLDQAMSNIYLLALPSLRDCDVRIVDGNQEAYLLYPGTHTIEGDHDDTVSLIPLSGEAANIRTENLFYPLDNESLYFGPARGVSNVIDHAPAQIYFEDGVLLIVHTIGRA
jgi:thiamine pyrophosphokinase